MPWPNHKSIGPNARFYQAQGVKGMFVEGAFTSYGGDLQALRAGGGTAILHCCWLPSLRDSHSDPAVTVVTFCRNDGIALGLSCTS